MLFKIHYYEFLKVHYILNFQKKVQKSIVQIHSLLFMSHCKHMLNYDYYHYVHAKINH